MLHHSMPLVWAGVLREPRLPPDDCLLIDLAGPSGPTPFQGLALIARDASMLKPIPAAEVDLDGKALEVRYKENPGEPNLLTVDILAHQIDGTPADVRRSELALVALHERMTRDAMHERVEVEAGRRGIERVAWVEEG
jgi:hypothetical protein